MTEEQLLAELRRQPNLVEVIKLVEVAARERSERYDLAGKIHGLVNAVSREHMRAQIEEMKKGKAA